MRLIIEPDYQNVSLWAANYVAAKINKACPTAEKPFVLGLPTGSSPLGMYKALIDLNKEYFSDVELNYSGLPPVPTEPDATIAFSLDFKINWEALAA